MSFQFEKLEVYQKALDWVETVETLCETLKGKISYSLSVCRSFRFLIAKNL